MAAAWLVEQIAAQNQNVPAGQLTAEQESYALWYVFDSAALSGLSSTDYNAAVTDYDDAVAAVTDDTPGDFSNVNIYTPLDDTPGSASSQEYFSRRCAGAGYPGAHGSGSCRSRLDGAAPSAITVSLKAHDGTIVPEPRKRLRHCRFRGREAGALNCDTVPARSRSFRGLIHIQRRRSRRRLVILPRRIRLPISGEIEISPKLNSS